MEEVTKLSRHPIVANQMNYNVLYKDEVTEEFRDYCVSHGIQLVAYQPIKRQAVLENVLIQGIASAHSATPAQIALSWLLDKNAIPIPKATMIEHIDENIKTVELKLTLAEIQQLDEL